MKSLLRLAQAILADASMACEVKTTQDWKTVLRRVEHEGDSFLTITLPAFAKDFERSLSLGRVADDGFTSFSFHRGLPRFLGGFLQHVFDANTGQILRDPCIDCIFAVRQFTMAFGKMKSLSSQERIQDAFDAYVACDSEVRAHEKTLGRLDLAVFRDHASVLFSDLLLEVQRKIDNYTILPKHGPGAVQEGIHGNEKYSQYTWHERLQPYFPLDRYLFSSATAWYENLASVELRTPDQEPPLRVIAVPKTMKTPRIIAIEPVCMQYIQQGIMRELVSNLERVFSGSIGFSDQNRNREYARLGSIDGSFATLDLSEASDRVSLTLVRELLASNRTVLNSVMACRSTRASVPGHAPFELAKFASMGSALCFPIEAMVFFTIVSLSIARAEGWTPTDHRLKSVLRQVTVYGDDIIVPADYFSPVSESLAHYGLKVNATKSFSEGNFRESCGGDYYSGRCITPVRVRSPLPETRAHVSEIVSTVSLRNQLWSQYGDSHCTKLLDQVLEKIIHLPRAPKDTPGLVRWSFEGANAPSLDPHTQSLRMRAPILHAPSPASELNEAAALMKFFLHREASAYPLSEDSLVRAGRPLSARIKQGWIRL